MTGYSRKTGSEAVLLAYQLENITAEIFEKSGYLIETESHGQRIKVDFIAKKDDKEYYIEVKSSTTILYRNRSILQRSIPNCLNIADKKNATPVLVVFAVIDDRLREQLSEYEELVVLDLSNLLFATKGTKLQEEFVSILPFTIDQIEYKPVDNNIDLGWEEPANEGDDLIKELDNCPDGKEHAKDFENICTNILKFIFNEDLSLWKQQQESNEGLFRFDLVCRIKDNTEKTLWSMIERFFNSKYIVFEFKNYTDQITQKEVYTTERYLYQKALRNVAILIAKNGFDNNSLWASKGCLRENGKLILLITIDDLKEMFNYRIKQQDPTEVLLDKVDELLTNLEK